MPARWRGVRSPREAGRHLVEALLHAGLGDLDGLDIWIAELTDGHCRDGVADRRGVTTWRTSFGTPEGSPSSAGALWLPSASAKP